MSHIKITLEYTKEIRFGMPVEAWDSHREYHVFGTYVAHGIGLPYPHYVLVDGNINPFVNVETLDNNDYKLKEEDIEELICRAFEVDRVSDKLLQELKDSLKSGKE